MSIINIPNLGTFTYNYKIKDNVKYNVISACLFKAKDVSNFYRYTKNLLNYKDLSLIKSKEFVFRLYYDDSILDDNYIKKIFPTLNKNYQMIHFDCPKFKNKEGGNNGHNGTFGTLIRYLPFHDFPENDVNLCYIVDVDGSHINKEIRLKKFLKVFKNDDNLDLIYTYWKCHKISHNIVQNNFILGQLFLIKKKLPIKYLLDYVNDFIDKIYDVYKELKERINKKKKEHTKYQHKFFYGIDEIYLELYLKIYFIKKGYKVARNVSYYYGSLTELLQNIFSKIEDNDKNFKKILNQLNKKFKMNYQTLNDFFNIFVNYDWYKETDQHLQYEFFYDKVIKLYKKNPKLEKLEKHDCFVKLDKFYDNDNDIEYLNKIKRINISRLFI